MLRAEVMATTTTTSSTAVQPTRRDWVRRLGSSTFNYWFGYVANITLVFWLVSHAFTGAAPLGAVAFASYAFIGLLSWTLSEWLLHRYVYHLWPSFLSEGHAFHHKSPRALIGVPWYLTTIALIAIYELVAHWLRPSSTGVVMGFNWLGYIFYCVAHHGSHHWATKRGWLKRMKRHHLLHHAYPEYNWGFTTPVWDHVFGTHYDRRRPTPAAAATPSETATPSASANGRS
jgi:sterol desaturase/sphingolipid hydroxylase (fatty acid hydroxylase superfamily)